MSYPCPPNPPSPRAWYSYDPNTGALDDPSSYFYTTTKPTCVNGSQVCVIYAENSYPNPTEISCRLRIYISNALSTGLAQPMGNLKKYVYLKTS